VTTTLSQKGQVVIPQEVRNKLRLQPGDDFVVLYSKLETYFCAQSEEKITKG
jgi:AbrB family looped-hinge helix DNA binding protein